MNFLSTVIHFLLPYVICILEIMAIIIIAGAGLNAFIRYIQNAFMQKKHDLQSDFAKSMVIGIEFAMAGEILKTILIQTLEEIFMLGGIILLRMALSLLIHFENRPHKGGKNKVEEHTEANVSKEENA